MQTNAEIVTDGTLGPGTTVPGPSYQISEDLGSRLGNNLFHSFHTFNIDNGESATFSGSSEIENVISRVTGGSASKIDGLLQSTIGNADVYLINPAGILLGQNAQIDVPASFYMSTAESLKFTDNSFFSITNPDSSSLSVAAPASFGFSNTHHSTITIDGSILSLNSDNTLSLSAHDIVIENAGLQIKSGRLDISAIGQIDGEIDVIPELSSITNKNGEDAGIISISQSFLDVSGNGAGTINLQSGQLQLTDTGIFNANLTAQDAKNYTSIYANNLEMNNAWIRNDNGDSGSASTIDIVLNNDLTMINGSFIGSDSYSQGNAASIKLSAQNLYIDNSLILSNSAQGSGNGNTVDIEISKNLEILNASTIGSSTYSFGNAGAVNINSEKLLINAGNTEQFTGLASQAGTGSNGNAGSINVTITELIDIQPGGKISTDTFGPGNAGNIVVKAQDLSINRLDNIKTGIFSQAKLTSLGDAGAIDLSINATTRILNGGEISSNTFSNGNAGSINLISGQLILDGNKSELLTGIFSNAEQGSSGHAGSLMLSISDTLEMNNAQISSDAHIDSLGNAGQINIEVSEAVTMLNGAYIGSNTYSIGNAGDIKLSADELLINGIGSIYSTGFFSDADSDSNGNAGTISLHIVNQLHMEQALISSNALINSKGNGGQINVDVGGLFSVSNDSVVNSNTFSSGDAGSININAANLQLTKGGEIASYTYAQGNAGSINITTLDLTADAQASSSLTGILSDAQPNSTGNAGSINISADKSITVTNGGRISSTTYAVGNAGNIDIQSPQVLVSHNEAINRTGILSNAEIGSTGNAGTIKMIVSDLLKVSNIGTISSDTYAVGDAGSIDIVTGQLYLSGTGEVYRTGISSNAEVNSSGNAGSVKVTISDLAEIFNGARISSSTFGQGNAGNLEVNASTMSLDGSDSIFSSGIFTTAYENSIGHAGQINVDVSGNLNILANANIASNTYAHGNAGSVEVHAGDLLIDSQIPGLFSGIGTETRLDASGDAGNIKVVVDGELDILHDGNISSISNTPGNAGNISIETDKLHINAANSQFFNISSAAYQNSSGEVGNIDIVANKIHLDNNAEISIAAYGNVSNITSEQLHHIFVTSNELIFNNGAFIQMDLLIKMIFCFFTRL